VFLRFCFSLVGESPGVSDLSQAVALLQYAVADQFAIGCAEDLFLLGGQALTEPLKQNISTTATTLSDQQHISILRISSSLILLCSHMSSFLILFAASYDEGRVYSLNVLTKRLLFSIFYFLSLNFFLPILGTKN
jgi:hypothetical protein